MPSPSKSNETLLVGSRSGVGLVEDKLFEEEANRPKTEPKDKLLKEVERIEAAANRLET